jgi:hypothetical protein
MHFDVEVQVSLNRSFRICLSRRHSIEDRFIFYEDRFIFYMLNDICSFKHAGFCTQCLVGP